MKLIFFFEKCQVTLWLTPLPPPCDFWWHCFGSNLVFGSLVTNIYYYPLLQPMGAPGAGTKPKCSFFDIFFTKTVPWFLSRGPRSWGKESNVGGGTTCTTTLRNPLKNAHSFLRNSVDIIHLLLVHVFLLLMDNVTIVVPFSLQLVVFSKFLMIKINRKTFLYIYAEVVTLVAGSLEAGGLPGSLEIPDVLK